MDADMRFRRLGLIVLLFGALSVPSLAAQSQGESGAGEVGAKARNVNLVDLEDHKILCPPPLGRGTRFRLVVFWSTWSRYSARELERLQKLHSRWSKAGIEILAVNVESSTVRDQEKKKVAAWLTQHSIELRIALDKDLVGFKKYGLVAVPTTFLIDDKGRILKRLSGWPVSGSERLIRSIERLLGKEAATGGDVSKQSSLPHRRANRLLRMGRKLAAQRQWEMAEYSLEQAIKLDPDAIPARILLYDLHRKTGKDKKAEDLLEASLTLFPEDPTLLTTKAALLVDRGLTTKANAILEKVHEIDPSYLPSFLLQAKIARSAKKDDLALRILDRVMKLNPLHPDAFLEAGKIREDKGEKDAAYKLYEKAYRLLRIGN